MSTVLTRSSTWEPVWKIVIDQISTRLESDYVLLGNGSGKDFGQVMRADLNAGASSPAASGRVAELCRDVIGTAMPACHPRVDLDDGDRIASFAAVPLKGLAADGGWVLATGHAGPREFSDADVVFLEQMAEVLSIQARLAVLGEQVATRRKTGPGSDSGQAVRRAMHLEILNFISEAARNGVQFNEIAIEAMDRLLRGLHLSYAALFFGLDGAWILVAHRGFDEQFPLAAGFLPAEMLEWTRHEEPVADFDPGQPLAGLLADARLKSWALVPLLEEDRAKGGLLLGSQDEASFNDDLLGMFSRIAQQLQAAMLQARLARELSEQTADLKAVISSLTDALVEVTADRTVLQANMAALELLGLEAGGRRSESWDALIPLCDVNSGAAAEDAHPVARAFAEGTRQPASQWSLDRDGQLHYVSATAAPICEEGSERVRGVVLVMRDVTEQRAQEQKLLSAEKHASVSTLAAGVAHEFKNYLGGIMGNASLAQQHAGEHEALAAPMQRILDIGARANQTALSLLSYVREAEVERQTVDLGNLIGEVVCLVDERATKQNIEIIRDLADDVCTDGVPTKVRQVLLNLITNAVEAMPEGGTLTLSLTADDDTARLTIQDTGVGIPAQDQSKIFDPFFSTKGVWGNQSGAGTGLGLTTSQNYVREQGGQLRLTSEVGRGTAVHIHLPRTRRTELTSLSAGLDPSARAILIMETDDELRDRLVHDLKARRYDVYTCQNEQEATLHLQSVRPGIAFLDTLMPGKINFIRTYESILEQYPDCRVVVTTGDATDYQLDEYVQAAAGRIVKPTSPQSLDSFLDTHFPPASVPA